MWYEMAVVLWLLTCDKEVNTIICAEFMSELPHGCLNDLDVNN